MAFAITEEQQQLEESLRRLLAEANEFESRRRRLRASPPDRLAVWPRLAELGVIGAAFDEAHGGFAGDARTVATIMSELGISLAVEPYLATAVVSGRILQHTTASWAADSIEALIAGREVCVLAHDAGADPFADPRAVAEDGGDSWMLSGNLRCIRHAGVATSFLVAAVEGGAPALFYAPSESTGVSIQTYRLIDSASAGDLHLENVRLPSDARLSFATDAQSVLHEALEWGLMGLSAETAGIVGALNSATFSYLNVRKQFGVPIGSFQALQHRAADMYIAAEEIVAAVDSAIESLAEPPGILRSAILSAAKVVADDAGRRVGHEAVQMHGGMGVSDELNVSHYARRLAAIRAELGSANAHRLRFSKLRGMHSES
jgi:alkylation response protein AidB-like acyl-CoA dehydrogenase